MSPDTDAATVADILSVLLKLDCYEKRSHARKMKALHFL
jgi:hypothetical protein